MATVSLTKDVPAYRLGYNTDDKIRSMDLAARHFGWDLWQPKINLVRPEGYKVRKRSIMRRILGR